MNKKYKRSKITHGQIWHGDRVVSSTQQDRTDIFTASLRDSSSDGNSCAPEFNHVFNPFTFRCQSISSQLVSHFFLLVRKPDDMQNILQSAPPAPFTTSLPAATTAATATTSFSTTTRRCNAFIIFPPAFSTLGFFTTRSRTHLF